MNPHEYEETEYAEEDGEASDDDDVSEEDDDETFDADDILDELLEDTFEDDEREEEEVDEEEEDVEAENADDSVFDVIALGLMCAVSNLRKLNRPLKELVRDDSPPSDNTHLDFGMSAISCIRALAKELEPLIIKAMWPEQDDDWQFE